MNHDEAISTLAVERYSLDEMTPEDREAFEQHYFECKECWTAVRRAEMFAQNAKLAARMDRRSGGDVRPFRSRRMTWIAPAAAAALFLVVGLGVVRQWVGTMPREGEIAHLYVTDQMRGGPAADNVLPSKQWATLFVEILPVEGAASYRLELVGPGGPRLLEVSAEKAQNPVPWLLRPLPAGNHELVIESVDVGGKRSEIARYPIRVGPSTK